MAAVLTLRSGLLSRLRSASEGLTHITRTLVMSNSSPLTQSQLTLHWPLAKNPSLVSGLQHLSLQDGLSQRGSRGLSIFTAHQPASLSKCSLIGSLNVQSMLAPVQLNVQPVRTRIIYSRRGGKPRTVRAVVGRFFRLHNGLWIRPKAGRNKRKWKKSPARNHRAKHHVVCNRAQCQLLDKMVNKYFRLPKHYVEDPYQAYHRKSNLPDYRYQPPKFLP